MLNKEENTKSYSEYFITLALGLAIFFYGGSGDLPRITWAVLCLLITSMSIFLLLKGNMIVPKKAAIYTLSLFLWIVPSLLGSLFYEDKLIHFKMLLETILYLIASVLISFWLIQGGKWRIRRVFGVIATLWIFFSLAYYIAFQLGLISYATTFSGPYQNRNIYAVVTTLILAATLFFSKKSFRTFITSVILVVLIAQTASIKGFLGVLLVLFVYFYRYWSLIKRQLLIFAMGIFAILTLRMNELLMERVNRLITDITNFDINGFSSGAERMWLLVHGFQLALENWLYGIGLYNSKHYLFPPWYVYVAERRGESPDVGLYTHNNYLEIFLSVGLFAFLLYYAPIVYALIRSFLSAHRKHLLFKFAACILVYRFFLDATLVSFNSFPIVFFTVFSLTCITISTGRSHDDMYKQG